MLGVLALVVVAGCSNDDQSAGTAAPDAGWPVSIEHKFGTTTITKKPVRIVTAGWNDQDFMLALDEVPVSTREWFDLLDRDVLFINGATKATMLKRPVCGQLKLVKTDRTLYTTFKTPLAGAPACSGPQALLYALDLLVPQLANALDNSPSTPVANLS